MPCVITHAMMSCAHCTAHACRQAGHPYDFVAHQKILIGLPFMPAEQYLLKLTTSHFNTFNMQIANQNVLERILIAMQNENKPDCKKNFRISSEESVGPLYKC